MVENLGAIDPSVLHLQEIHISRAVSNDNIDTTLEVRRSDNRIWGLYDAHLIHHRVLTILNEMGFYGVLRCGYRAIDNHLITALVERWRRETHTFHLRVGEATITLQDVEIIWGLNIEGEPVTGTDTSRTAQEWQQQCVELLGFEPDTSLVSGGRLSMAVLDECCRRRHIDNDSSDQEVIQYARRIALMVIGGCMLPDYGGGGVRLMYLQLLRDVPRVRRYSWGSAVLAFLYRGLCRASIIGKKIVYGPLSILQIWAWSRITSLSPDVHGHCRLVPATPNEHDQNYDAILPIAPYGARWARSFSRTHTSTHSVRIIRDILDRMEDGQFYWTIYDSDSCDVEPFIKGHEKEIWQCVCPLICFDIVEMHRPNRVLRQFGMQQQIPEPASDGDELHKVTRIGHRDFDWKEFHRDYTEMWNNKETHVAEGEPHDVHMHTDYHYMQWYNRITIRFISPTSKRVGYPSGEAYYRSIVDEIATTLMNRFGGLSLQGQSREALEQAIEDDWRIGRRLREALTRMANEENVPGHEIQCSNKPTNDEASCSQQPHGLCKLCMPGSSSVHDIPGPSREHDMPDPLCGHDIPGLSCGHDMSFTPPPRPPPPPRAPSLDEYFVSTTSTFTSSDSKLPSPTPFSTHPQIPVRWPDDGTLTVSWVSDLMQTFDWASRTLIPSEFPSVFPVQTLNKLVLTASKILHKEPNCVRIDENSGLDLGSRVVVVGDVHGQLHDVLFLLKDAGFPSDDRFFVFNGNYVDRGAWGLEVFLILLAWKVLMPHRVFLLRGNHESKYCTSVYGFEKEVASKYGDNGKHVFRKCLGCFGGLPLASIIAGKVYTAHGGLFRGAFATPSKKDKKKKRKTTDTPEINSLILGSLEELAKARRSVLDPPWEGSNLIPGDVLWSDPSMSAGLSQNTKRCIGLLWGPDCTEEFLTNFNLKLIIRSHEGPDARGKRQDLEGMDVGYTIDHIVASGKLITVFSAPDYPQFQATEERYRNKGAYIVLEPPQFDSPIFHSFEAVSPRPKANAYYDFENVIDSDEELNLASMVGGF